jgi:hypothetical protein
MPLSVHRRLPIPGVLVMPTTSPCRFAAPRFHPASSLLVAVVDGCCGGGGGGSCPSFCWVPTPKGAVVAENMPKSKNINQQIIG